MYATAAPLKGAVILTVLPPVTDAPVVVLPVPMLSHSTERAPVAPDRFTLALPPLGKNTRYSLPITARQYPLDERSPRGTAAAMFMRRE